MPNSSDTHTVRYAYKLTDKNNTTYNNTVWGENVTHELGENPPGELCRPGWFHFYDSPLKAVIFNRIHANFNYPKLWVCKVEGKILEPDGTKGGCTKLTTLYTVPLPTVSTDQLNKIATKALYEVFKFSDKAISLLQAYEIDKHTLLESQLREIINQNQCMSSCQKTHLIIIIIDYALIQYYASTWWRNQWLSDQLSYILFNLVSWTNINLDKLFIEVNHE